MSKMHINSLRAWFEEGSRELGVSLVVEPTITATSGVDLKPVVWLPDFGGNQGMLVFEGSLSNSELPKLAKDAGYSASTMGSVTKSFVFEIDDFVDLLCDWGWSSYDKPKPNWLRASL